MAADGTASSWSKRLLPLKTVPEPDHTGAGVPMSTRADESLGTGPGRGCWRRQWAGGWGPGAWLVQIKRVLP